MTVSRARMLGQDAALQALVDKAASMKDSKPAVANEVHDIASRLAKQWQADMPAPTVPRPLGEVLRPGE
jgi:hypothetical protein